MPVKKFMHRTVEGQHVDMNQWWGDEKHQPAKGELPTEANPEVVEYSRPRHEDKILGGRHSNLADMRLESYVDQQQHVHHNLVIGATNDHNNWEIKGALEDAGYASQSSTEKKVQHFGYPYAVEITYPDVGPDALTKAAEALQKPGSREDIITLDKEVAENIAYLENRRATMEPLVFAIEGPLAHPARRVPFGQTPSIPADLDVTVRTSGDIIRTESAAVGSTPAMVRYTAKRSYGGSIELGGDIISLRMESPVVAGQVQHNVVIEFNTTGDYVPSGLPRVMKLVEEAGFGKPVEVPEKRFGHYELTFHDVGPDGLKKITEALGRIGEGHTSDSQIYPAALKNAGTILGLEKDRLARPASDPTMARMAPLAAATAGLPEQ